MALTPLLLVQVANGDKTVEEAEQDLVSLCKHPGLIGKHSSNDPDPVLMAAIANDATKEVLIFKQSAGTGFDAPRAFVLASTKPVNDVDFAMQFIGRVMRVARPIRQFYAKPKRIPAEFDTAYVYLADAEAQRGFEAAVQASSAVKSQLEGQTEKLVVRQMASGAQVYTNRESAQVPLIYDLPLPDDLLAPPVHCAAQPTPSFGPQASLFDSLAAPLDDELDEIKPTVSKAVRSAAAVPTLSASDWQAALQERGIRAYARRSDVALPKALQREVRPQCADMARVSEAVASRLELSDDLQRNAVRAALSRLKEKEVHTELTAGACHEEDVLVMTDRAALAGEAVATLRSLPQVEDDDVRIIVDVLSRRLRERIDEEFETADEASLPGEAELKRHARDAAYWVIRREAANMAELMQGIVAEFTTQEAAAALPDWMLFPAALSLAASRKNIYGVMPPADDDLLQIETLLLQDERAWLADREVSADGLPLQLARYDGLSKLNSEEREFAKALDHADFVTWWHRNPDRKPWSVRLVRGEHQNYFYPDFVICLSHYPGDAPLLRLVETKENVKDAARKARRVPKTWGKVLFLTRDQARLRVVNDDGSLGVSVDFADLNPVREWLRASKPV